jgi:hypothetical protein
VKNNLNGFWGFSNSTKPWVLVHPRCRNCTRPLIWKSAPLWGFTIHNIYLKKWIWTGDSQRNSRLPKREARKDPSHAFFVKENKGCHNVALPFTLKKYLKAKEELWNLKYVSPSKNIIFKKILLKKPKSSRYHNSIITNLKFQHKPKLSSFKNPHIKNRPIIT